jgi:hypothetical protein
MDQPEPRGPGLPWAMCIGVRRMADMGTQHRASRRRKPAQCDLIHLTFTAFRSRDAICIRHLVRNEWLGIAGEIAADQLGGNQCWAEGLISS